MKAPAWGRRGVAAAACAMLACAAPARAQGGEPAWVLDRSAAAATLDVAAARPVVDAFSSAYARAGKPRVALFWNRELDDRLARGTRDVVRAEVDASRDGRSVTASVSRGTETDGEALRRTTLSERDLWLVEAEFVRVFLEAGTTVVDRAAIMRLAAARERGSADAQGVEMAALKGHADLFLEVLLTGDPSAPLGWGFRCNLKEVKSGRLVSTQYLTALPTLPAPGAASFRARDGGYERVAAPPPRVTVRDIGVTLALDAMRELTRRLAR